MSVRRQQHRTGLHLLHHGGFIERKVLISKTYHRNLKTAPEYPYSCLTVPGFGGVHVADNYHVDQFIK
jgi:hypothetical protein